MARKLKKIKEVAKFGGVDELGSVMMDGHKHEASSIEAKSEDTHLEDDKGQGAALVIRRFVFGANPEAWKDHVPTKQELFNFHWKGIEVMLWRDGLVAFDGVEPRIVFAKDNKQYQIFVAARPSHGNVLTETPQTLSQIAHGN